MATIFEKISGDDEIFNNKEYINDSLTFNAIESARKDGSYNIYSDHKNVVILTAKRGPKVWLWTSSAIKDDTNKLIDICRFLRDCKIPRAEIYLKQDVSSSFSDLYALTTLEINYIVKDEFSLAVYTYTGEKVTDIPASETEKDEEIIKIDKNNPEHVRLITDFYSSLKEEFRWTDKFERKLAEYLENDIYALLKDGRIVADSVIGGTADKYLRIKSIAVLSDERKKGYGYMMCIHTVNEIIDRGFIPVLYTHIGNASAVALWGKSGFNIKDKLYLLKIENND